MPYIKVSNLAKSLVAQWQLDIYLYCPSSTKLVIKFTDLSLYSSPKSRADIQFQYALYKSFMNLIISLKVPSSVLANFQSLVICFFFTMYFINLLKSCSLPSHRLNRVTHRFSYKISSRDFRVLLRLLPCEYSTSAIALKC